jgi:hypothetical protein
MRRIVPHATERTMREGILRKLILLASVLCVIGTAALALSLTGSSASAHEQPCDFLTSGGFIITTASGAHSAAQANFAVAGGCKHGSPTWGHLQYQDKGNGLKAKGTSITAYMVEGDTGVNPKNRQPLGTRIICGKASTNLYGNVDFRVRARDRGEPGSSDEFDIRLKKGADIVYETEPANQLDGGNIQLHKPNPSTSGSFGGSCPAEGSDEQQSSPDVSVSKSTDTPFMNSDPTPACIDAGICEIRYQLVVHNAGPGTALNVMVTDDLPVGATGTLFWSMNPPVPGCIITDGTMLDCTFPSLAPGTANDITINVRATADSCVGIENQAFVSAANEPTAQRGNNASDIVGIDECQE